MDANLKILRKKVQDYAIDNGLLSDMTAVSLPVPLSQKEENYHIVFMLYFSTPSLNGGHKNPDITIPYAYIIIDFKTGSIINITNRNIDFNSVKQGISFPRFNMSDEQLSQIRELYEENARKIFLWYWRKKDLTNSEKKIAYNYNNMNKILMELPLVSEYHNLNPEFFKWVNMNSILNIKARL